MSESQNVMIGEEEISLDQLAGIDLTEVKEVRSSHTPAGKFQWRVTEAKLEAREATNKEDPTGPKIYKATVQFELKSQNCFSLVDAELAPEDYIDITHRETFWIGKIADIGRVKAFLVDMGIEGNKALTELLDEAHGQEFVSEVTNRKNADNPDYVYANIKGTMTMDEFAASQSE